MNLIDMHSHILPNIDDGARDIETSVKMLTQSYLHGVGSVLSTSHCYPKAPESIEHFLLRRKAALNELNSAISESDTMPHIYEACEVNMTTDISELRNISKLCIENTDYILVEMPYTPWREWMIDSVYKLTLQGLKPIMAHIDRFIAQNPELLNSLFELDVLYQVNAELFLDRRMTKAADKLIENGRAHVLGSDMHNLDKRKPNLKDACDVITLRYGHICLEQMIQNARSILNNEPIPYLLLKTDEKKGFWSRIFK